MSEAESVCKIGIDTVHLSGSLAGKGEPSLSVIFEDYGINADKSDLMQMSGRFGYAQGLAHPQMLWVLYLNRKDEPHAYCLQLKGAGCSLLGLEGVYSLVGDIMESVLGTQCTRLDICADLYASKGSELFDQMELAVDAGDCWRANRKITKCRPIPDKDGGVIVGRTLYIGGRESAIRRRVYDKGQQLREDRERGERVRIEDEYHEDRANTLMLDLLGEGTGSRRELADLRSRIVGALCSSFEFKIKKKKGEWSDVPWFADLKALLGFSTGVFVPADRKVASLERWLAYFGGERSPMIVLQDVANAMNALYGGKDDCWSIGREIFGALEVSESHVPRNAVIGPLVDLLCEARESF